jgi:AcrR family transcriptional regulator
MTIEPSSSPRRRPKGDKRERTRARIIEAAAQLVEEKGYEATTVQEIARRAGLSNGAIYGNFNNREEILSRLGPTYWPRVRVGEPPAGANLAEIMLAVANATIAAMPARRRFGQGRLRGMAYTLGSEPLRRLGEGEAARRYDAAAQWWRKAVREEELPMPVDAWVRVIGALIEGLTFTHLAAPGQVTDEVIRAAFAALAGSRAEP